MLSFLGKWLGLILYYITRTQLYFENHRRLSGLSNDMWGWWGWMWFMVGDEDLSNLIDQMNGDEAVCEKKKTHFGGGA